MIFEPQSLDAAALYKLLTGAVIPRPIAWVSTQNLKGQYNLAPFSYFNIAGDDPPHLVFTTMTPQGQPKDTLRNILDTDVFVVNMVTEALAEAMNTTSAPVGPEVDEFVLAGVTPLPGAQVQAPRVAESPIAFECQRVHHYALEGHQQGGATVIIGKIVCIHVQEGLLNERMHLDPEVYRPVSRLAGAQYAKLGEVFTIKRPIS